MKTASVQQIRQELEQLPPGKVLELCVKVIKFKKDSKELASYLLFDAHDEAGYIENIKAETADQFAELPHSTLYLTKKSLRKILRNLSKYARHMNAAQAEAEIRLHFCNKLLESGIPLHKSPALVKMYQQQLKKIRELIDSLHEDLRYDFTIKLNSLS
jgi:hypothetical protein